MGEKNEITTQPLNREKSLKDTDLSFLLHTLPNDLKDNATRRKFLQVSGLVLASASALLVSEALFDFAGKAPPDDLTDKEASEYSPLPPIQIEGKWFSLVGVRHNPPTFYQNHEDVENRVKSAPFVFLEYFDEEIRNLSLPTVDDRQLYNIGQNHNDRVDAFLVASVGLPLVREKTSLLSTRKPVILNWLKLFSFSAYP